MLAIVHFTVGISAALLILTLLDWRPRHEVLTIFLSGFWAMSPDVHWLFRGIGLDALGLTLAEFHGSVYANVFWCHTLIDALETGHENLEAGLALMTLIICVGVYYLYNEWDP